MEGSQHSLDSNKGIRKKEEIFFEEVSTVNTIDKKTETEIFLQTKRSQLSQLFFVELPVGFTLQLPT